MTKRIFVFLVMVAVTIIAGCGGGGGGDNPAPAVETWSPAQSTVPVGDHFTQTSNLGGTRDAIGTWNMWANRHADSLDTALFKTFTTETVDSASPDGSGGILTFGVNNTAPNNKGVVVRLDAQGSELWRSQIDSPLGNTLSVHSIKSDGQRGVTIFKRAPLNDVYVYGVGMDGSPRALAEVNIGYNLVSAKVAFDGNYLAIATIDQTLSSKLIYASMVDSSVPTVGVPLLNPEFLLTNTSGIIISGRGSWMSYDRNLSVAQPIQDFPWISNADAKVYDVVAIGNRTFVAGRANDSLVLHEIGNPAFRSTQNIPMDGDVARLGTDGTNLYISVGGRFGKVDLATGEMASVHPMAVPNGAPWFISGGKAYFIKDNRTLHVCDLSMLH